MKKIIRAVWKATQWIIAVTLGIAALGAFMNSFGAGLCWLVSALLICPTSRNALIKLFAKKNGVLVKDNLLKKNKGAVNSILCGVVAVTFLCIGSETLPKAEVINSDYIAKSTIENSSEATEEHNEVIEETKEIETIESSESVLVESTEKEEELDEISKETSEVDNVAESSVVEDVYTTDSNETEKNESEETGESVLVSFEESSEPIINEHIVSDMEVHFIDVGQADAALVLCGGEAMLIDGGNTDDSSLMYTYLKNMDISYLDYVIATHAHEDHVGGLAGALNYADVGVVYCPITTYDSEAFSDFKK